MNPEWIDMKAKHNESIKKVYEYEDKYNTLKEMVIQYFLEIDKYDVSDEQIEKENFLEEKIRTYVGIKQDTCLSRFLKIWDENIKIGTGKMIVCSTPRIFGKSVTQIIQNEINQLQKNILTNSQQKWKIPKFENKIPETIYGKINMFGEGGVIEPPSFPDCNHRWKETKGFTSSYYDCEICGKKKEDCEI